MNGLSPLRLSPFPPERFVWEGSDSQSENQDAIPT
jgi:hypothetical protein